MQLLKVSRILGIILCFTLFCTELSAQLFIRKHARKNEKAPKAVLVQLPTYQRRITYLQKTGDTAKLQQVKNDADSMQVRIVLDFNDHLKYCPVYYFYDNDLDKIKNGQFDGVLLASNLQPVHNPVISAADKNYFIVLFGIVYVESDETMSAGQNVNSSKHRLQVFDSDFKKLKKPLPTGTNNVWAKSKRDLNVYRYQSPKFNINYNPSAAQFNAKLYVFYGNYPY